MKNTSSDRSLFISENLPRLYAFAHLLTSDDKNAEELIHLLITEIKSLYRNPADAADFQTSLFRLLYELHLKNNEPVRADKIEEPAAEAEQFYLYKRMEEEQIYDHEKILEFIAGISQIELENLISEIPKNLRPYRFLKYVCDFSYQQIATILNVPIEYIEPRLAMVNKIIQARLWENMIRDQDKAFHRGTRRTPCRRSPCNSV
jgi:DNA-directed RNA polymerase specialized sigma24 family protein